MDLLKIRTEHFEGPLDLLLFLIQKNEMDVSAISIHRITDQYVQCIELMRELDFDLAGEFLTLAATLIYLKSRSLLPGDAEATSASEGVDAPLSYEEIERRLKELERYREAGSRLLELPISGRDVFARPGVAPPEKQTVWRELDITGLALAFQDTLKRERRTVRIIRRDPKSVADRIRELSAILKVGELTEFASVLSPEPDRPEIILTFLALLELARLKKLRIFQNEIFGSIYLTLSEPVDGLDPGLITGFEEAAGLAPRVHATQEALA